MPRRRHLFDTPDRFTTGTIGEPGHRTFFLQAREGDRVVSVSLEKVQVAAPAQRMVDLLEELEQRGVGEAAEIDGEVGDAAPLDEPLNEAFRVGTLSLGWDTVDRVIVLEAREITDDDAGEDEDDDGEEGPDLLRVRISPAEGRHFVARAVRVIAAGRPPCPLCGEPLDPQGHLCPRRNGHLLN